MAVRHSSARVCEQIARMAIEPKAIITMQHALTEFVGVKLVTRLALNVLQSLGAPSPRTALQELSDRCNIQPLNTPVPETLSADICIPTLGKMCSHTHPPTHPPTHTHTNTCINERVPVGGVMTPARARLY